MQYLFRIFKLPVVTFCVVSLLYSRCQNASQKKPDGESKSQNGKEEKPNKAINTVNYRYIGYYDSDCITNMLGIQDCNGIRFYNGGSNINNTFRPLVFAIPVNADGCDLGSNNNYVLMQADESISDGVADEVRTDTSTFFRQRRALDSLNLCRFNIVFHKDSIQNLLESGDMFAISFHVTEVGELSYNLHVGTVNNNEFNVTSTLPGRHPCPIACPRRPNIIPKNVIKSFCYFE